MSRWFRHYAGMARDDKLVSVAIRSKQTVERVVWVWGAILESAAEIDENGRFELDAAEVAYFLRADQADIERVVVALEELGRLHAGSVAKWGDRQFQSDRSAERQKRYRDKRVAQRDVHPEEGNNVTVTAASRHGDAPETETETETEDKNRNLAVSAKKPAGSKSSRGSRLSANYQLPEQDSTYAAEIGVPSDQTAKQFERFRDYWTAKAGKDGVKLDWSATWRNWIRKFADERGFAPTAEPGAPSKPAFTAVTPGTAQWDAWYEFKRSNGTPTRLMDEAAANERPFPVPTEWPPATQATAA
jgi:hypothetical protein